MEQLQKAFYDYFSVQLKDVQVIVAKEGDDWEAARRDHSSPLHILQPTRIDLRLDKSLMDDARLPKLVARVVGFIATHACFRGFPPIF